ncbi:MAG: hypothetical protein Kow00127_22180 [Bacteroidales bacterium]
MILTGLFSGHVYSTNKIGDKEFINISKADSVWLSNLPFWNAAVPLKSPLPAAVNNSVHPWFRPLYVQSSVECGQYSGIAFNFCYEIDYRRGLPANQPENQYPAFYTFNFMNEGTAWHGVSYRHSFEIARSNGHPNAVDYGNEEENKTYWMSGYEKYYNGMHNKLREVFQIRVNTEDGLEQLKRWLADHGNNEPYGGLASFYSASPWNPVLLPAGTPEGGKHVITAFAGVPNHACTIVGYNDSIRYDFNQDGLYTVDIDINGDNIVDLRDREIGGLLFTDSYNGGTAWADSGFCYMMYKTLAESVSNGGIWNHSVHIVTVNENYSPKLTVRANISCNCRKLITVKAGISTDPDANYPEYVLGFPLFDYQGGCLPMGGNFPNAESLEIGLDFTPLLGHIQPGNPTRLFLIVTEDDPQGYGSGSISGVKWHFYGDSPFTVEAEEPYVAIQNNATTRVSAVATFNTNNPVISNLPLPVAQTGKDFQYTLTAEGGTPPYRWDLVMPYSFVEPVQKPSGTFTPISFQDTLHGLAELPLPFPVSFFGNDYDTLYVHTDGFVMFDNQEYPWPYLYDEPLMIQKTRIIAPLLSPWLYLKNESGDRVEYLLTEDKILVQWHVHLQNQPDEPLVFSLLIRNDGAIGFYYDAIPDLSRRVWASGISEGDGTNYYITETGAGKPFPEENLFLFPQELPSGMKITPDGTLSCTPQHVWNNFPVEVVLTDNDWIQTRNKVYFTAAVAGITDQTGSGMFSAGPVPAKDFITLRKLAPGTGHGEVTLFTADGQRILKTHISFEPDNKVLIPLSRIEPGVYLIVFDNGSRLWSQKLIIRR